MGKRPPYFTTVVDVDVDVDISPSELEEAGWVYMGADGGGVPNEHVLHVVRRWHEENHTDPWRWCDHELCRQLGRDAMGEPRLLA